MLEDPFAVQNPLTGYTEKKLPGVRVQITAARDEVFLREIYLRAPEGLSGRRRCGSGRRAV